MPDHFDTRETQSMDAREASLFGQLVPLLELSKTKSSYWQSALADINISDITDRDALAKLPVLRKSDLLTLQTQFPPFGGLTTCETNELRHLFMSPGPIFDPAGKGSDWWNAARALHAAGFKKGDIVHNSFSYHLTPAGMMFESGADAIGCAVIPAGVGQTEQQVIAAHRFGANAYTGIPDFLKILLEKAEEMNLQVSFTKALVSGAALPESLRSQLQDKGISTLQCYGTADLGIVAYESISGDGMIVSEDVIMEIVTPGTGEPVAPGEVGEIVVTRLNKDYPLIRFATGDMTMALEGASACGRTNMRIRGWMGRADQRTKIKGMFVDPAQIASIAKQFPEIHKLRLEVSRENDADVMCLRAEVNDANAHVNDLMTKISDALRSETKLGGTVELADKGSLPNDGKVIADLRPIDG